MSIDPRLILAQNIPNNTQAGITDAEVNSQAAAALYSYEQDTNRLARGNPAGTSIVTRDSTRKQNIATALSIDTWDEPPSAYGAVYPHNHVYQTPNGLIQEFDDTPGSVRYHRYHPAGTFVEVDNNGTEVRKIVGDNYYIIERNGYIFIGGEANITVSGPCNILVTNDVKLQVDGKLDGVVKNDINLTTSGNFNLNVKETFKIRAEELIIETKKFDHKNIGAHVTETNTMDVKVAETHTENTKVYNLKTLENALFNSGTDYQINTTGKYTLKSGGETQIDASKVAVKTDMHLQNSLYVQSEVHAPQFKGTVQVAQFATTAGRAPIGAPSPVSPSPTAPSVDIEAPPAVPEATPVQLTGLVVPGPRAFPDRSPRPPLTQTVNRYVRAAIENDEGGRAGSALYPGYNASTPYCGPDANPIGSAPSSGVARTSVDSTEFINNSYFTGEEQISRYVKLKDLTTHATFGHRVRAQAGLTEGQIVSNLQALAVNVIDRIAEKYGRGSFIITSGFRPAAQARGGSGVSQHGLGQAVDIQFVDLPNNGYADRAQELLGVVAFDQLILEYQTTGTGRPWIHISYSGDRCRSQYFTMLNHQRTTSIQTLA